MKNLSMFVLFLMPFFGCNISTPAQTDDLKPVSQSFTATAVYNPNVIYCPRDTNVTFFIDFSEFEVSDDGGFGNISYSSNAEGVNLNVDTVNGVISSVTILESETGEPLLSFVKK